ncbi:MAG TPA: hypothetical protein VFW05_13120 [Verrucomicrobiae bacterium]|nr:hypothetical protein [Verrucomicrobiae bacterium]
MGLLSDLLGKFFADERYADGVAKASPVQMSNTPPGTRIGISTDQKLGLFGVAPVVQPSGADPQAVTLGNVENAIGGLAFSDPPTQAELQALSSACETLAADVRALSGLIHSLRASGVSLGLWKGTA